MTKGEYRVGTGNNPKSMIGKIKRAAADMIDMIETIEEDSKNPLREAEVRRLKALAQKAIEEGEMWAMKAITKGWIE